ncbi:MAG: PadR family transcriptional regulator [Pirellulaceae bacterium]|nr:PadR family transcriptional regulator [Planctomycetales bacterium]
MKETGRQQPDRAVLLQGTLDMLVLRALSCSARHGYDIARWIEESSADALEVEEGSLYPALHRMERKGWISAEWGQSAANRRAKFYKLTRAGRAQLTVEIREWELLVRAISQVLHSPATE